MYYLTSRAIEMFCCFSAGRQVISVIAEHEHPMLVDILSMHQFDESIGKV
jgi:hypothetical protein